MITLRLASIAAGAIVAAPLQAETKVEVAVEQQLVLDSSARVIVITRPDPEVPGGGPSLSTPGTYVAQVLGDGAAAKPLGSLRAVSAQISHSQLERLRSDPNVEAVFADIPVPPATNETIRMIGADVLHSQGVRGTNLAVAVLDTGIDGAHPAFKDAIAAEACFSTTGGGAHPSTTLCPNNLDVDVTPGSSRKCPSGVRGCDHGTHVAGIVVGRAVKFAGKTFGGVSPGAKIVMMQVFSSFSKDEDCNGKAPCVLSYTSDQLRALEWVWKKRAQYKIAAVNMSLGGGSYDQTCDDRSPLTELIERLRSKGVLTVIAAGNDAYYDSVGMPGCISSAVTVAATNKSGAIDVGYSNNASFVDIVAPGTSIQSAVFGSEYKAKTGTSMAAPHVAGALTLLREKYPNASAGELQSKLVDGAPTTIDPRNGFVQARLDLFHGVSAATTTVAAAVVPTPDGNTLAERLVDEQSFIIQTTSTSQQVASSVENACPKGSCNLKKIGERTWKLDISPSALIAPGKHVLLADDVKGALKSLSTGTKIFENSRASPMGQIN